MSNRFDSAGKSATVRPERMTANGGSAGGTPTFAAQAPHGSVPWAPKSQTASCQPRAPATLSPLTRWLLSPHLECAPAVSSALPALCLVPLPFLLCRASPMGVSDGDASPHLQSLPSSVPCLFPFFPLQLSKLSLFILRLSHQRGNPWSEGPCLFASHREPRSKHSSCSINAR